MAKKPWGTITHPKERNPSCLMGYQKMTGDEVHRMVNRLYEPDWVNRTQSINQSIFI